MENKNDIRTIDETGNIYSRLTVLERSYEKKKGAYWLCQCECGNKIITRGSLLRRGETKSCGCLSKEIIQNQIANKRKHGQYRTNLYKRWRSMIGRCYSKNKAEYHRYAGRGITVCEEWLADYMNFYNWAINNGYKKELSIDRINNDGNYEPSNCRWVTMVEQRRNQIEEKYIDRRNKFTKACDKINN